MKLRLSELRGLIRESILAERPQDWNKLKLARRMVDKVGQILKAGNFDQYVKFSVWRGIFPLFTIDLSNFDLEPDLDVFKDLTLGFSGSDEDGRPVPEGYMVEPGKWDLFPGGIIILGLNGIHFPERHGKPSVRTARLNRVIYGPNVKDDKWGPSATGEFPDSFDELMITKKIDPAHVVRIFEVRKSVLVHELVHFLDYVGSEGFATAARTGLEKAEKNRDHIDYIANYFTSNPEVNAYFFHAVTDMIDTFEEEHPGATQEDANAWAPHANDVWNKFKDHAEAGFRRFNDDKLIKRVGTRAVQLWDEYVSSLKKK
jgi:hypothetical protein